MIDLVVCIVCGALCLLCALILFVVDRAGEDVVFNVISSFAERYDAELSSLLVSFQSMMFWLGIAAILFLFAFMNTLFNILP